jgi:hypothetical protein
VGASLPHERLRRLRVTFRSYVAPSNGHFRVGRTIGQRRPFERAKVEVMACHCCEKTGGATARQQVDDLLESVNFRDIAEQANSVLETLGNASRQLKKAERAEHLGLGADVAALYRRAAEREDTRARRQMQAVIDRLDERTRSDDWNDLTGRMRQHFDEHDGRAAVDDARDRWRLVLFEADDLTASYAVETMATANRFLDRAQRDGLNGVTQLLRDGLDRALGTIGTDDASRKRRPPIAGAQITLPPLNPAEILCITIACAAAAVALIACFWVSLCFAAYFIAMVLAVAVGVCLDAF